MDEVAPIGIVLGSGLGAIAGRVVIEREVSFAAAGLPASKVPGHAGRFAFGHWGGVPVVLMLGRVHLYEGHAAAGVAAGVRWLHAQGVRTLVLTNAAGCLDPALQPGEWMMLRDHLNLTGTSPLEGGPHFVDLSEVYDAGLRSLFAARAAELGLRLHEGVYAGLRGPQYETPAEVRMLRLLGADAVGMSTVLEAIAARALGMRVAAFSCLTNWAAGIGGALGHGEVIEVARRAGVVLADVLERVVVAGDGGKGS
jgi:purine-nucleoside phosphorylase